MNNRTRPPGPGASTGRSSPRTYMGCTIDRQFPSGTYYALTSRGSVRADTIAGIKQLIREREKPQETIHP